MYWTCLYSIPDIWSSFLNKFFYFLLGKGLNSVSLPFKEHFMLHVRLAVYCMCADWITRLLHLSVLQRWTQITYAKRASNVSPCYFALLLLCFSCRDLQKTDRFPLPGLLLVVDIACFSDKRKGHTNLKGLVHYVTVGLFLRCMWSTTSSSFPCLVSTKINSCWRGVHQRVMIWGMVLIKLYLSKKITSVLQNGAQN